jgi:hypothetical protein
MRSIEVDSVLLDDIFHACSKIAQELTHFVCSEPFRSMLEELSALPEGLRHEYVDLVLLDPDLLRSRGVSPPPNIEIQRSYFSDGRPTLFSVTKRMPAGLLWEKITITFDNETLALKCPWFAVDNNGELLPIVRPL